MDRSHHQPDFATPAHDELRQIRREVSRAQSLNDLRFYFDRVQNLRRNSNDDFDLQLLLADAHDEIIERGRLLRETAPREPASWPSTLAPESADMAAPNRPDRGDGPSAPLELPEGTEKLDSKTWQRATYLALFFALLLFFAFFYLVQTARRLNFPQAQPTAAAPVTTPVAPGLPAQKPETPTTVAQVPLGAALRLYTDLIPATLTLDEGAPLDVKDGEFTLDRLEPGRHVIRVTGKSGNASVTFDSTEGAAPHIIGQPSAANVMAVAVSAQNGRGTLITNAESASVLLDGKAIGQADSEGVELTDLGQADHDLQVTESKDRQRFVLTYNSSPSLTFYVKSDPNAGTVVISAGQDGVEVYIDDKPYRRLTERGTVRVPLKVGEYTIRVHKPGFIDPAPQSVQVKKAEESPLDFRLEPQPQVATLQVHGALPGTMIYVDKEFGANVGADGSAAIPNIKPGEHAIELRRDQAVSKLFDRTFQSGDVVLLSGPDVALEKTVVESKPGATLPAASAAPDKAKEMAQQPAGMEIAGEQVRKGGGFIPYPVPKSAGRYSFQAQARHGGLFKRGKVQWYAGYVDSQNYILYTLDGKRATVREVRDGKSSELGKSPFEFDGNEWVQVDISVKANSLVTRVKSQTGGWEELPPVQVSDRDLTQDRVGMYIPGNDEVAIANFRFAGH